MPLGGLFVRQRDTEQGRFVVQTSRDHEIDGRFLEESRAQRDRRMAGQVREA
jgi:hypothetical protein